MTTKVGFLTKNVRKKDHGLDTPDKIPCAIATKVNWSQLMYIQKYERIDSTSGNPIIGISRKNSHTSNCTIMPCFDHKPPKRSILVFGLCNLSAVAHTRIWKFLCFHVLSSLREVEEVPFLDHFGFRTTTRKLEF